MTVDETKPEDVGAMVTGTGGHMVSLSAKVRRTLGKDIGDKVTVTVTKRARGTGDHREIRAGSGCVSSPRLGLSVHAGAASQ